MFIFVISPFFPCNPFNVISTTKMWKCICSLYNKENSYIIDFVLWVCTKFWLRHLSGDSAETQFSRPRDLDLIQSTPLETLSLKTPPRVLTLNEQPLDFLEEEQRAAPDSEEVVRSSKSQRRMKCTGSHTGLNWLLFFVFATDATTGAFAAGALSQWECSCPS